MEFDSFSALVAMGKHGPFVWSAYGICLLVLAINVILPVRRKKQIIQDITRRVKREQSEL